MTMNTRASINASVNVGTDVKIARINQYILKRIDQHIPNVIYQISHTNKNTNMNINIIL